MFHVVTHSISSLCTKDQQKSILDFAME